MVLLKTWIYLKFACSDDDDNDDDDGDDDDDAVGAYSPSTIHPEAECAMRLEIEKKKKTQWKGEMAFHVFEMFVQVLRNRKKINLS